MKLQDEIYLDIKQQLKKNSDKDTNKLLLLILWILVLPSIFSFLFIRKPHEFVPDINNLPEPIQTSASWWTVMYVNWEKVYIDFLAEYDVQWRVLSTRNYSDAFVSKSWNKMSPRDFVLWWWPVMSKRENIEKFEIDEYLADRIVFIVPKYEYNDRFVDLFGVDFYTNRDWRINKEWGPFLTVRSNNHPIWSSWKINLLFKKVRVWDAIRLKWYLVYVHPEKWWWRWWPSSLVRDDEWCEIIYVTDITWLKQRR